MRWLAPVLDRDDEFAPFLTADLPVPASRLRLLSLLLVLASLGIALGVVLAQDEQVQLAGLGAGQIVAYLVLISLPTRRLHRYSRVDARYAAVHLAVSVALIGWTWTLPLPDHAQLDRRAVIVTGLFDHPHPAATAALAVTSWTLAGLTLIGGITLHVLIQRMGKALAPPDGPVPG